MSSIERDDLSALILESTDGWVPRDRSRLVQAVNAKEIVRHRRCSQEWCENALNIFSQPELDAWTNRGAAGMNSTLTEIITRVMQLGGKLICEDTKKLLCALWLFYRGDGRELGNGGSEIAFKIFKDKFTKSTRNFEPSVMMNVLPVDMIELKSTHPLLYDCRSSSVASESPCRNHGAECGDDLSRRRKDARFESTATATATAATAVAAVPAYATMHATNATNATTARRLGCRARAVPTLLSDTICTSG